MAWLSGYTTRKKITIDQTKVDADLSDFPVAVILTVANFDFSKANADGFDIRFTSDDGTTLLKYERERHDSANSLAEYWVKVPAVSSTTDTNIYIYYRTTDTDDGADPTNVWDSNFKFVHHLKNITATTVNDSTANADNGAKIAEGRPIEINGKVGKGQDFETSTKDYITLTNVSPAINNITIDAIIKRESTGAVFHSIIGNYTGNGKGCMFMFWNTDKLGFWPDGTKFTTSTITDTANFYHIAVVLDSSNKVQFYINGVADGSNQTNVAITAAMAAFCIGRQGATDFNYFDGIIDEIRYSNIARSAAWIKADYNSGNNSLLAYGGEEEEEEPPVGLRKMVQIM